MKKLLLSFAMLMSAIGAWAGDVQLQDADGTKFVNMPYTGTDNLTLSDASVMTFKVYDNGGVEDRYSNNSDGYLLITAPEGYALQLTGTVQTETTYDYLTVYDGTTNEAAVLREKIWSTPSSGNLTDIGVIASTGRSLLLYFHSDNSSNGEGLNLDVTLFNPNEAFPIIINEATGGVMHSSKATAKFNEEITLTWTHETGYVLESISITDAYGRPISFTGGSWYNAATHFTMPPSAATVTPTFVKATTSVDGLFVNFPETGQTKTCDIATGVQSFKVYDSGGADEEYPNNYDGYVVITAPEGLRLQLTGTITGESNDYLTAYDGTTNEADVLFNHKSGTGHHGPASDIGIITTTGNSMMLYFHTDNSNTDPGLDLEVTLFDPNEAFPINISTVTGGSMTSDKSTAKFAESVALTETHENGYVLKDILVKDVNDRTVEVEGGTWYRVDASFTMPASEVTVTPTFIPATTIADGLFINMLKEGTITTNISTGVKSFKVYDNGGAEGEYSDYCNSYLVLNVPEGYQIQVTGTIDAENCDKLTFYDGTDNQAPVLMKEVTSKDSHNLSDIGIVTSSGRSMTIYFYSDGSQTDDGYDLNVYVFNPNEPQPVTISQVTGGAMASNVPSAKFNEVITLTETHERGYVLESTTAVDANGTPVAINGGTWYNVPASFNMPIAKAIVTPKFTTGTTAEDGLFINMPKEGTLTTDICNGIKSFKVYDDGGAEGEYSNNCEGYLMLQAPIGYRLRVTGTVASENGYDYLSIYDGTEVDEAKRLLKEFSSPSENNKQPTDIGEYGSTARTLLLYFRSDSSQDAAGLDLTVELIPITYTLAFDNGQAGATGTMAITGSMESITLTYDAPQNLPATGFSRTAYNFLGWSAAVDGDVVFADKAEVENLATEQDAVVTIYGKWQPIVYPITYDLAGGAVEPANLAEYTIESADFTLTNPTKQGYTFTGWTGTDLSEKTIGVTVTTGHYGDRAYTATWEPNPYKIHFDINGGNGGTMADQNFQYDAAQNLTANAFTRTGYTFKEWNSKADGTGTVYINGQEVINLTAVRDEVITMYAQWTPNPYQVRFNANNGEGTMANQDFIYDVEQALTENAFTRTGYTFEGWNTAADGSGTAYADKASVKNLTAELNGIVDVYAQWKVITYNLTYDLAGGALAADGENPATFNIETPTFTLKEPARTGYIFDGWTGTDLSDATKNVTIAQGSIGDRSYTANWTPITYQIVFNANEGTGNMANLTLTYDQAQTLIENTFTRTAYTFDGWNTAADGSADSYADKAEVKNLTAENNATVTMYAQWKAITYTITYDLAGGSVATANPTEYNVETATFTLTNPTREGYTFVGWTGTDLTEPTETVTIAQGSIGDRSYTATWQVQYVLGDINGDGVVDVSDYIGVANHIMGQTPTDFNEMAGDVDANGIIDVSDYIGVANIILTGNVNGTQQSRNTRLENQRKAEATDLSTYDNVIYVAPQTVTSSETTTTITLSICMKNTADIRGFQFDMYLPDGVTARKNAKGKIQGVAFNADRLPEDDEHTITLSTQADGAIRFLIGSMYDETFTGNDGELMTMEVEVAANLAEGDYPIILKNMKLTETDISKFYEATDVETTLTVTTSTGISAQWSSLIGKPVFDLNGRKVADEFNPKRLHRGVYIVEGRKVVLK